MNTYAGVVESLAGQLVHHPPLRLEAAPEPAPVRWGHGRSSKLPGAAALAEPGGSRDPVRATCAVSLRDDFILSLRAQTSK